MIRLNLPALSDADAPFVTRLRNGAASAPEPFSSFLIENEPGGATFAGQQGLVAIDGVGADDLDGDIVLVEPRGNRVERLLRAGSPHNTLLVTERCDQLCVMCSQPPKKTHVDRFALLEEACLLAEPDTLIGISGGEPTLYKEQLLTMLERVLTVRQDLQFHVLSNGQHFEDDDIVRLRSPLYHRVSWGIPLYATDANLHDEIVGKAGAFARLEESFARLIMAGARVELRTVVLQSNLSTLPRLARYVAARLSFVEAWSIMQLEHIGFAKGRWNTLFVQHAGAFGPIADALTHSSLHGLRAQLFNFPLCTVPPAFRSFAVASISDWKRKYAAGCVGCTVRTKCSGFFEWHPEEQADMIASPL